VPTYTFNFNLADQTLDHMSTINQNIRTALDDLERTCLASMAEWTGAAREQYTEAKRQWDFNAQKMNEALQAGRQSLFQISDGYGSAEQRAQQIWANTYTGG
jgi:WXG100 family type VII secretion target